MTTWRGIQRMVRSCSGSQARDAGYELDNWEREARGRVVHALVRGMKAEQRYQEDATFHTAINTLAEIAAAAVFNDVELTRDEMQYRRDQFDAIELTSVPFGLSPDV